MAMRNILTEEDERLRKKCRPVTDFNSRLWELLEDMAETMEKASGVGIAAPQVGVLRRAVLVDIGEGLHELINAEITEQEGEQTGAEGCLSIPGEYGIVHRPQKIHVKAQDRNGNPFELDAEDYLAVAICHELDHMEGVLFTDKVERMLTPEELAENDEAEED